MTNTDRPAPDAAPKAKRVSRAEKALEELQAVGADIVPSVTIEAHPTEDPQLQPDAASKIDSLLTDQDIYLFNEGSHHKLWEKLGSHMIRRDGIAGTNFAVWAPNA
ncbi:MAG: 1,4-alpha-glucan branching protein GlgB, partial [Thermoanaerobaculia bacterium]